MEKSKIVVLDQDSLEQSLDERFSRMEENLLKKLSSAKKEDKSSKWVTKQAFADEFEVNLGTIRLWEKEGKIKGHRAPDSTRVYFLRSDIDKLMKSK